MSELPENLPLAVQLFRAGRLAEAETFCDQVVRDHPTHPLAAMLLGTIRFALGDASGAVEPFQLAVRARPDDPEARVNLFRARAHAHLRAGTFAKAIDGLRGLLVFDPLDKETQLLLAGTCSQIGEPGMLAAARRATVSAPERAAAWSTLGDVLASQGEERKAEAAYRTAIARNPSGADARANLAELMRSARRSGPAESMLKSALILTPERVDLWRRLASLFETLNRLDQARAAIAKVAVLAPGDTLGMLIWATLDRREGAIEAAIQRLSSLPAAALDGSGDHRVLYELGQLHDRLGDAEAAHAAFSEANRLMGAAASQIDASRYLASIEGHIRRFTRDWVANWTDMGPDDTLEPVFLIGFPRSGTTLMDQILDSHPRIRVLEEEPLISTIVGELGARHGDYLGALAEMKAGEIEEWRARYLGELRRRLDMPPDGTDILVDKMPLNIVYAGLILRLFPQARIVLALRHPCDVVLSNFMQAFELNDAMANFLTLEEAARLYDRVMTLWTRYVELLAPRHHVIRYEDLVADLEGEARRLLDFLEVPWDDAVLAHTSHARDRAISTPSFRQVTEPVYTRARYRWRRYEAEMAPVMGHLSRHIEAFGYE